MRASTRPRMNLTWRLSGRFFSQASTNPRLRNWSRYWIGTSRSKLNQSGLKERLRSHCSSQAATSHFRKRIRGRPERTLSMIAAEQQYPWYSLAERDDLEQGDILESCRVFSPPADLADDSRAEHATFGHTERDVIVMSQSCDLVKAETSSLRSFSVLCGEGRSVPRAISRLREDGKTPAEVISRHTTSFPSAICPRLTPLPSICSLLHEGWLARWTSHRSSEGRETTGALSWAYTPHHPSGPISASTYSW